MECLLFGGAASVGKSNAIFRLATQLITPSTAGAASAFTTFRDVTGTVPSTFADFRAVLEGTNNKGQNIRIIVNSPTDTTAIIQDFKDFYDNNGSYDILISSVKDDSYSVRNDFFRIMNISTPKDFILELPLAKITRHEPNFSVCLAWYERQLDMLVEHILNRDPFNL